LSIDWLAGERIPRKEGISGLEWTSFTQPPRMLTPCRSPLDTSTTFFESQACSRSLSARPDHFVAGRGGVFDGSRLHPKRSQQPHLFLSRHSYTTRTRAGATVRDMAGGYRAGVIIPIPVLWPTRPVGLRQHSPPQASERDKPSALSTQEPLISARAKRWDAVRSLLWGTNGTTECGEPMMRLVIHRVMKPP
jgi:hypothetical protein